MAHPEHARTPRLKALLVGKRTVPGGCRVLNVSQQGMSLQCDPDGRLLTLSNGDSIDVYLSVQHANGHNKFTIPAIVSHVDESTIDVVFHCTDPELAGLIESYRTSEAHTLEAAIDHRQIDSRANTIEPVTLNESTTVGTQADNSTRDSRSFYSGLFILFITSLLLLGAYYSVSGINTRLHTLETVARSHTDELAEVQTKAFNSRLQEGRYAALNARMLALTDTFQSLEKHVTQALSQDSVSITTTAPEQGSAAAHETVEPATDVSEPNTATAEKAIPAIEPRPAAAATDTVVTPEATPVHAEEQVADPAGPWVINLLSSPYKAYIDNAMTEARARGVDTVVTSATTKGRQYWRLQITGFESMAAAKAAAEPVMEQLKEPLKIKDIWIHRQ